MRTPYLIPLTNTPQTLTIALAGVSYELYVYWCRPANAWMLDIADASGTGIISGIPLVTGADLLAQYTYKGIAGQLIAQTAGNALLPPTFANLGNGGYLYFVTTP